MRRLAIFGAGTLGRALMAAAWTAAWRPVIATRRPAQGEIALDLASEGDVARFLDANGPFDAVINAAAMTDVDACEKDPEAAHRANALAAKTLARECARRGTALVHVSTNYVFSGTKPSAYAEDDATGPCSIYGMTKLEGEWHALSQEGAAAAVVRTSWIFGGVKRDFVRHFIEKFGRPGDVPVVSDQTASLTYARDLAEGLRPVVEAMAGAACARRPLKRVYHVTNSGDCTRYDMLLAMKGAMGKENKVVKVSREGFEGWAAVRPAYSVLSNARYEAEFGLRLRPWRDALAEFLAETRA